jgi:acyl carrier protein
MQEQQLIEYIRGTLGYQGDLDTESELFSGGALDSTAMMQLIMFIEEAAGVQIRADDVTLENFDTVSRIVRYVSSQQS